MSKQEDYFEGWGPLYYDKMIKLQVIKQVQQNLVDSQTAEIAALKAEVERLNHEKLIMRDVCEGQSGAISDLQRQAKIELLREVLKALNEMPRCTKVAFITGALEIRWLKQLELSK